MWVNRWERNALNSNNVVPFDSRLVNGSISGCQAKNCDQQEQNLARIENGSEIRISCEAHEVTCEGWRLPGCNFSGCWKGSNGTKAKRLAHNDMPSDAYLQRQMADRINSMLVSQYQPIASEPNAQQADTYLEQQRGQNGNEAQQWRLRSVGNGVYVIENVRLSREQGIPMILDYKQGNVTYLEQQRGPNGNEAQQWKLRSVGNEVYVIENVRLSREQVIPMILDYSAR